MLTFPGANPSRFCDGLSRRNFLKLGTLGLGGLTLAEFLRLPEEKPALEFQDGMVTQKVSPQGQHGWLQGKLAELFNHFAEPLRLARAFTETRVTFDGASLVPDVVVYRWDRIPRTPAWSTAPRRPRWTG